MKTALKWLLLTPLALAIVAFAVLNRQVVSVVPDVPEFSFEAPLFAIMFACGALGALAGGFVTWVGQGKHRRNAREAKAEATRLRASLAAAAPQTPVLPAVIPRKVA